MVCSTPPARATNPEESALPKEEAGHAEKTIRVTRVMEPMSPGVGPAATSRPAANAQAASSSRVRKPHERVAVSLICSGRTSPNLFQILKSDILHVGVSMLLSCFAYLAGAVFLAGSVFRAAKYARTPVPLRWELYPIPPGAAGQIRYTVAEVLLLRGVWQNNRKLWFRTYPFHMGIYLCAVSVASLAAGIAWFTEI